MDLPYITKYLIHNSQLQAGGHQGCITKQGNCLIKKISYKRELEFYLENKDLIDWIGLIPHFFNSFTLNNDTFISIENIIYRYSKPCVLDIKIGNKTWCDETEENRKKERIKLDTLTTQNILGFRFCGMTITQKDGYSFSINKKIHLEIHSREETIKILSLFIHQLGSQKDKIINYYIQQMEKIKNCIQKMKYHFFSSSLLFVYDAESYQCDCRLIDFSHYYNMSTHISKIDDGVIEGINTLSSLFTTI
ncbi:hypothetical protein EDI_336350 [Entamoeba dispar SAW760]|uniref:Kinase n=1 Tax=Entamoeba dispar (strain ATCC PRA-260 / SAW760) TaxID=370354 RepID=B0ERU1_ENTDS|nr:uncharacterized protein EDI_336350 [Entamoeba dispar SAW760]EDR22736.1 hypothetical protein EDI_336350 [Entamoeba dispar SAW760]|eukprot:EDR22736.1 hypothetical protein EDI_336350 [Entamoeba dispar SAW760]